MANRCRHSWTDTAENDLKGIKVGILHSTVGLELILAGASGKEKV